MKKLGINTASAIYNIVNCVFFASSWFVIFGGFIFDSARGTAAFFYALAWIGVVLNAIAIYQSKRAGIKTTGAILGVIGNALFGITTFFAFPAIILLIISIVFLFQQAPVKKIEATEN